MLVLIGGHLALAVAVVLAWGDRQIMPLAGLGVLAALWALAQAVRHGRRFVHVGAGYGYALLVLATALSLAGIDGIAQLCLTASAGLIGAIAVTFLPAIGARNWQAVLLVATVPFAIGVVQVVFERSGWTALSTGLMFLLALSLLLTRRPGLTGAVRTLAAGMLVPTLAVVLVCLGAQLLPMSGSPVVLPVIAVVIALVLPSGILIRDALVARGRSTRMADAARVAIEASSLLTAVIAVALAFTREAAGPGVACLVLLILGIGAVLTALVADRRYGWVLAGASFTGALWSLWWLAGVELPEAYLLPPTLGAALVGVFLTLRGVRAAALFTAALVVAIVPLVVLVAESEGSGAVPWRAYGLLAAGGVLAAAAALLGRGETARLRRLQALRVPTALAAGIAAPAGTIQAVRWGVGADTPPPGAEPFAVFLACLAISVLSALVLASAAAVVRGARAGSTEEASGSRWLTAPAVLALAVGVWPAIERDWPVIWAMWTLMIVALVVVVIAASRRRTSLPPVWFLFGVAFVTGVVAWSPRDLRVEWFSLPMGAFLLLAGAIGLRAANRAGAAPAERRLGAWPHGWGGSWALLAPGIVVTVSASIVATFTDPLTWRAILVMVLALAAILVGASRRLAAPFLIGLVVLPIENVFVFSVQLGRNIEAMPWWITLALMGAVLLIIAVAGERREGAEKGVVARVRDLR
ncbi:SCO7613 C-terminal domain-containing membrane protein [Microbacterium sp. NIBRBAC000506063]|uniref:SCO7613 C-terminal domain-containing membrane protein n=1 Tax=Microbacterium sp. NIBRBAC000506063 TaxID=2734618 RepID=UPI001BB7505A|nr:hypothetical protein [Microbacterium sp. NIBRBAC000506063]QTV79194.1 hypothetical protein KAE78_08980 [Microbacterium sp. NIBRBAC000506063]